jgi:hypothetical protein
VRPWSRHDLAFLAAAAALVAVALGGETFDAYPRMVAPLDEGTWAAAAALLLAALFPFADRRGIGR